jgi:site-specific DNA recombinase
MLAGLARCSVCGGGLTARTRSHGKVRVPFYECLTHRQRGASVCSNAYQIRAALVEQRILSLFDSTLLSPQVALPAVELALKKLRPSATQQASKRKALEAQRRTLENDRSNLTAAIARGGDLDSLVTALKTAESQYTMITSQLTQLDAVDALTQVDTAALRQKVEAFGKQWGGLAQRDPRQARQILRKLLADRLVFAPTLKDGAPAYHITGEGRLGPLLAGALPAHQPSAPGARTPSDVLQRWWPQRDSNPCFSLERAMS